jgi:hypothetical protein
MIQEVNNCAPGGQGGLESGRSGRDARAGLFAAGQACADDASLGMAFVEDGVGSDAHRALARGALTIPVTPATAGTAEAAAA